MYDSSIQCEKISIGLKISVMVGISFVFRLCVLMHQQKLVFF